MPVPESYLEYPIRKRGYDHDRFPYLAMRDRKPLRWPTGEGVALLVTVNLDFYECDAPLGPIAPYGSSPRPTPNYMQSSLTDYGLRVGIYRVFKALDRHGIKATALVNSNVAVKFPYLLDQLLKRDWEIAASGVDMGRTIAEGMPVDQERALIAESVDTLRRVSGQAVTGWQSPAYSSSENTFDLLAENGIAYCLDWTNDDLPYPIRTASGAPLHALPVSDQWQDANILGAQQQHTDEVHRQAIAAFEVFRAEAESRGGRVLHLPLNPAVVGQPFRIGALENLLADIEARGGAWQATGSQILKSYLEQQE